MVLWSFVHLVVEKYEEKRFDKANRELMGTNLFCKPRYVHDDANDDVDYELNHCYDCMVWVQKELM